MTRVLVAGVPRSGTTWVGDVLGRAQGAFVITEPDNINVDPLAGAAKRALGRYPVLAPGDVAGLYATLWKLAFRGGWPWPAAIRTSRRVAQRFSPRTAYRLLGPAARIAALRPAREGDVIVKTVYGVLALEWIAQHSGATVLVVRRNLLDVVSSWAALEVPAFPMSVDTPRAGGSSGNEALADRVCRPLGIVMPGPEDPYLRRVAWTVGVLDVSLDAALKRNPGWHAVRHEDLCADPETGFRDLVERVGLRWDETIATYLRERNTPGSGYVTRRVAAEVVGQWRQRLSSDQLRDVAAGFDGLAGHSLRAAAAAAEAAAALDLDEPAATRGTGHPQA